MSVPPTAKKEIYNPPNPSNLPQTTYTCQLPIACHCHARGIIIAMAEGMAHCIPLPCLKYLQTAMLIIVMVESMPSLHEAWLWLGALSLHRALLLHRVLSLHCHYMEHCHGPGRIHSFYGSYTKNKVPRQRYGKWPNYGGMSM